uniref:Uncharacterized protein n=1 Tax=Chromera velia CCMP2878 TaxID=1169474 RepID=A0A0G4G734_9ALVE|eukprot:Cvel_20585.t1-p1 / transcript=Cvel_20585.t1 / gene=Cvel_20585 / organism=Chromera_velia_CCMP2878 / gene_product=hypothetical protein / transcript_product=hypothetical protein / location=Cvel_scaffold1860:2128-2415(-) / protein_length=96 / sequence_SO=supercontig / SO=protein_coding / is_pseudo=false
MILRNVRQFRPVSAASFRKEVGRSSSANLLFLLRLGADINGLAEKFDPSGSSCRAVPFFGDSFCTAGGWGVGLGKRLCVKRRSMRQCGWAVPRGEG